MSMELRECPFCGSQDVHLRELRGEEGYEVMCFKCGSKGAWSEDAGKSIASWNKRVNEALAPRSLLVALAPRMYELLKEYCGIVEEFVSIYDNFPAELQEVATTAREIIEECEVEEEEDD